MVKIIREGVYITSDDAVMAFCEYDKNTNKIVSINPLNVLNFQQQGLLIRSLCLKIQKI